VDTDNHEYRKGNTAEDLWCRVLKDFENEKVHSAFIDYCVATGQLPLAGEKYRSCREERGNTPLIDRCIKRIVLSAQVCYLPDQAKERAAQRGPLSRLFAAFFFLLSGFIAVALFIAYPAARIALFIGGATVLACVLYRMMRKW